MSVSAYSAIIQGPLASFLKHSQAIGGDVAAQAQHVEKLFQAQHQFLNGAARSQPPSKPDLVSLLQPTSREITAIQELRERCRTSKHFNHLSAVSESISALGWVADTYPPAPYIKEMNDAAQYYTDRILREWKDSNRVHVEWVKAWIQTLSELQQFVKQHHTTGLVWGLKAGPPSPGGKLPPPPVDDLNLATNTSQDQPMLFSEINKGENITSVLKRVSPDMQTHKNPGLGAMPPPPTPPANLFLPKRNTSKPAVGKSSSFAKRDGRKWIVEHEKGKQDLVIDGVEMNNVVYAFKCEDSTLTVKGKLSSVVLDSCRRTAVVVDSVVTSIEFVNCQSVQMQVLGKVPTIAIDNTDGCQMYLSQESMDVEIVSSKSSEMNVMVPKGDGDYVEYPIPEQNKTTVAREGLATIAVGSKR